MIFCVQNPDIVLVHYLNVPYPDDNKMLVTNSVSLWGEKKEWTKEELISQLKPMCKYQLWMCVFHCIGHPLFVQQNTFSLMSADPVLFLSSCHGID